jgi:dienelactone hydrolase
MEPFAPAVDGYVDVADGLSTYLQDRAAHHFERDRHEKQAFESPDDFEAHRKDLREALLEAIGGLPDHPDDLAAETTGVVEQSGYTVESVVFESLPNVTVTANCYLPAGDGPHPGVLFLCGHASDAKADTDNQRACIELARNGVAVLIVDPIGQAERRQYVDRDTGESFVGAKSAGGIFEHSYAGQKCFYAGANLMRWILHDNRCALTYLRNRPEVDADRICVTGTSGGGIQTALLALVDDRMAATALACSVTMRAEWLPTGKRVDGEQILFDAIPAGFDYDDHVTAAAPKPVFVGAAASDQYFPIEGAHTAVERARRVYDLYDDAGDVEFTVADEQHCSIYDLGDEIFEWICETLDAGPYEPVEDHALLDEETLYCTPEGNVLVSDDDERTIDDLIEEYVEATAPVVGDETDPTTVRERVVETLGLDREHCTLHPRYVVSGAVDGLDVTRLFFKTERDPDVVCTGVLVSDPDTQTETPAIVCYEEGTEGLPECGDEVADLAAEHGTVLVFDPRGVGAVRNREIPIPTWHDGYYRLYGTEFKLGYDALLLGESLFGMRVYDTLRACEFLRDETDCETVSLVGKDTGAYHALYAAVVDESVESVDLHGLGPSFREMTTTRRYEYESRLTVFDVLDCDVQHCLDALADDGVSVDRSEREKS